MSAPDIRYEFSVLDEDYAEQAGGSAPTYAQALDEGQRYLAQYQQDGVHTLELRRVEVLGSTPPAEGEVGEAERPRITPNDFRRWWRDTGSESPAPSQEMVLTANAWAEHCLARWGRPAPPVEGEMAELVAALSSRDRWMQLTDAQVDRAADLLEQQQGRIAELEAEQMRLKPVPVGERLPGPEDCFIVKNQQWEMRYCWLAKSILHAGEERLVWDWRALPIKISLLVLDDEHWTHWLPANAKLLPAHALPVPSPTAGGME